MFFNPADRGAPAPRMSCVERELKVLRTSSKAAAIWGTTEAGRAEERARKVVRGGRSWAAEWTRVKGGFGGMRAGRIGVVGNGHIAQLDGVDDGEEGRGRSWDGIPQGHAVIGALMLPNCDKVSLGLLCGLHEMAMRE